MFRPSSDDDMIARASAIGPPLAFRPLTTPAPAVLAALLAGAGLHLAEADIQAGRVIGFDTANRSVVLAEELSTAAGYVRGIRNAAAAPL